MASPALILLIALLMLTSGTNASICSALSSFSHCLGCHSGEVCPSGVIDSRQENDIVFSQSLNYFQCERDLASLSGRYNAELESRQIRTDNLERGLFLRISNLQGDKRELKLINERLKESEKQAQVQLGDVRTSMTQLSNSLADSLTREDSLRKQKSDLQFQALENLAYLTECHSTLMKERGGMIQLGISFDLWRGIAIVCILSYVVWSGKKILAMNAEMGERLSSSKSSEGRISLLSAALEASEQTTMRLTIENTLLSSTLDAVRRQNAHILELGNQMGDYYERRAEELAERKKREAKNYFKKLKNMTKDNQIVRKNLEAKQVLENQRTKEFKRKYKLHAKRRTDAKRELRSMKQELEGPSSDKDNLILQLSATKDELRLQRNLNKERCDEIHLIKQKNSELETSLELRKGELEEVYEMVLKLQSEMEADGENLAELNAENETSEKFRAEMPPSRSRLPQGVQWGEGANFTAGKADGQRHDIFSSAQTSSDEAQTTEKKQEIGRLKEQIISTKANADQGECCLHEKEVDYQSLKKELSDTQESLRATKAEIISGHKSYAEKFERERSKYEENAKVYIQEIKSLKRRLYHFMAMAIKLERNLQGAAEIPRRIDNEAWKIVKHAKTDNWPSMLSTLFASQIPT